MRNMDTNQFEWNYDASIISKNYLKNVLTEKIIKNAENFVCLMAPFWTWSGVKFLNLIDELKVAKRRKVKIYLFGKSEDSFNAKEIFRSFYEKNGIKNCWLVKDLHSKIYFNETYILISSANITKTALNPDETDIDDNSYNFEDSILLRLKKVQITEKRLTARTCARRINRRTWAVAAAVGTLAQPHQADAVVLQHRRPDQVELAHLRAARIEQAHL
jgi:HKD family nuclease